MKVALPVAIVLIGLRISADQVRSLGLETLALVVAALAVGLGVALALARLLALPRRLGILLALGTAICGNTAIVAAAPLVRARRDEIAYAVATVTVFGTAAVLLLPPLGNALGLRRPSLRDLGRASASTTRHRWSRRGSRTPIRPVRQRRSSSSSATRSWARSSSASRCSRQDRTGLLAAARRTLGVPWFVWGFAAASALASLDAVPGWSPTLRARLQGPRARRDGRGRCRRDSRRCAPPAPVRSSSGSSRWRAFPRSCSRRSRPASELTRRLAAGAYARCVNRLAGASSPYLLQHAGTRSTGTRGERRRSSAREPRRSRCSSRSGTARATGVM